MKLESGKIDLEHAVTVKDFEVKPATGRRLYNLLSLFIVYMLSKSVWILAPWLFHNWIIHVYMYVFFIPFNVCTVEAQKS